MLAQPQSNHQGSANTTRPLASHYRRQMDPEGEPAFFARAFVALQVGVILGARGEDASGGGER